MDRPQEIAGVSVRERPVASTELHQTRQAVAEEMPPARRSRPLALVLFLALVCVVVGVIVYGRWQGRQGLPEGLIQVNGRMEGDSVTIAGKFAGRIAQLLAREGDTVSRGQVLVRIDDAQTCAQL